MSECIYKLNYLNPIDDETCEVVRNSAIVVDQKSGMITRICPIDQIDPTQTVEIIPGTAIPGLYDMHFHWVQDEVCFGPKDDLLVWLQNYTWPYEAKFADVTFAKKKAIQFSQRLLTEGTIGGLVYASLHPHTVDLALENFKGDFRIGHPLMDQNSPKYLTHSTEEASKLIDTYAKKYGDRYVLTPRFAPSTGPQLMRKGSELASKYHLFIQTHLAETIEEIDYVLELFRKIEGFEDVKTYSEIYDRVGLLGPKTFLGHCIHLNKREWQLLKKRGAWIVHCPTSNAPVSQKGLGSGLFSFEEADNQGVPWVLGSDIGAGPVPSMLDVMSSFVEQNKMNPKASFSRALYRSTRMAARGLERKSGAFEVGLYFDAVIFDQNLVNNQTADHYLSELLLPRFRGTRSYSDLISRVYFSGKEIKKNTK